MVLVGLFSLQFDASFGLVNSVRLIVKLGPFVGILVDLCLLLPVNLGAVVA